MEPFSSNPRTLSAATALPPHRMEQREAKEFARRLFAGNFRDLERLLQIFDNALIETRHFCQPLEWYGREWSFPERNDLYVEHALELSEKAVRRCLDQVGAKPEDVGALFFVSTTGISTPSLDAKLLFQLAFGPNLKRIPVWGLGCVGGAAGVARAADYARAYPDELVLVVAVELCNERKRPKRGRRVKVGLVTTSVGRLSGPSLGWRASGCCWCAPSAIFALSGHSSSLPSSSCCLGISETNSA